MIVMRMSHDLYSQSVRRHSLIDRVHDMKKISSREEKLMLQRSLEAEVSHIHQVIALYTLYGSD